MGSPLTDDKDSGRNRLRLLSEEQDPAFDFDRRQQSQGSDRLAFVSTVSSFVGGDRLMTVNDRSIH